MGRPNIILFTGEDTGRHQGCYGDTFGRTPAIDRLAREGSRFTNAISTAPVCSPSRSSIITGQFPAAICTHNHRSHLVTPPRLFTEDLRDAGYHVNWGNKTDFNFDPPDTFADTRTDWTQSLDALDDTQQPFFLYYNFNGTHESRLWPAESDPNADVIADDPGLPAELLAGIPVPPYLPDTRTTRSGLRRYYDGLAAQDALLGRILAALDASGLRERTIVIYASDHGRGEPRGKRWLYEAGIHMPLVVSGPGIAADTVREDLVSWVDLAPTVLALAGVPRAERLHGRVFLGPETQPEPAAVFAGRDRMDEAYDRCRAARDRRFLLIANDFPQLPWGSRQWYEETSPILKEMRQLEADGRLRFPENVYFQDQKPPEELYDTVADPHCLHNLIDSLDYAATAERLRSELATWRERYDLYGRSDEREHIAAGLVEDRTAEDTRRLKPLPEHLRHGGRFDTVQYPPE